MPCDRRVALPPRQRSRLEERETRSIDPIDRPGAKARLSRLRREHTRACTCCCCCRRGGRSGRRGRAMVDRATRLNFHTCVGPVGFTVRDGRPVYPTASSFLTIFRLDSSTRPLIPDSPLRKVSAWHNSSLTPGRYTTWRRGWWLAPFTGRTLFATSGGHCRRRGSSLRRRVTRAVRACDTTG